MPGYLRSLINRRAELMLHFGQPFDVASRIPLSEGDRLMESQAFKVWQDGKGVESANVVALAGRLDAIITSIGNLGETMARIVSRRR